MATIIKHILDNRLTAFVAMLLMQCMLCVNTGKAQEKIINPDVAYASQVRT